MPIRSSPVSVRRLAASVLITAIPVSLVGREDGPPKRTLNFLQFKYHVYVVTLCAKQLVSSHALCQSPPAGLTFRDSVTCENTVIRTRPLGSESLQRRDRTPGVGTSVDTARFPLSTSTTRCKFD
ncbi:hypothetical protein GCM10027174_16480 [Salinifilum aidingensis]